MKLLNKNTGKIGEGNIVFTSDGKVKVSYAIDTNENNGCITLYISYDSISEMNEDFEIVKKKDPLIKDEKIRKAVRAWAEMHNIKKVFYCKYSWKNNIGWLEDAENDVSMVKGESPSIDIPIIGAKNREYYTIAELCGEEDK